jgi:hypothetical protein
MASTDRARNNADPGPGDGSGCGGAAAAEPAQAERAASAAPWRISLTRTLQSIPGAARDVRRASTERRAPSAGALPTATTSALRGSRDAALCCEVA